MGHKTRDIFWRYGVIGGALIALLIVVMQALTLSISLNDGNFIYGLDDAYIHMSIAGNFVEHGVWGVTQYGFTSATSSPLWVLILSIIYAVIGVHDYAPLVLNILLAGVLLVVIDRILYKYAVPPMYRFVVLMGIIIMLPLVTLILMGMEHVLQILLCVLFIDLAGEWVARSESPSLVSWQSIRVFMLGAMVASVRYECLFLVLIFCIFLALRRRWRLALVLGGISILPITVYGLIAMSHGWEFLPTSLLLKTTASHDLFGASLHELRLYFVDDLWKIFNGGHMMFAPTIALLLVYVVRYERIRTIWDARLLTLLALIFVTLLNIRMVSFPEPGTFSRYEAYLVVLWMVVILSALADFLPRRFERQQVVRYVVTGVIIVFVMQGMWYRYMFLAYKRPVVTASENIYQQQYQMARFLATYYDGQVIGANDIGAISYFTDVQLVDLYGLATIEVTRAKHDRTYDTNAIRRLAYENKIRIAIVYETWFAGYGGLPEEWVWVGQWEVTHNVMLGYHQVNFYAVDQEEVARLTDNLRTFSSELPEGIIQSGLYVVDDVQEGTTSLP